MKKFVVTSAYYDNTATPKTKSTNNSQNNILSLLELLPKLNISGWLNTNTKAQNQTNYPLSSTTKYNYTKTANILQKNRETASNLTNCAQNQKDTSA